DNNSAQLRCGPGRARAHASCLREGARDSVGVIGGAEVIALCLLHCVSKVGTQGRYLNLRLSARSALQSPCTTEKLNMERGKVDLHPCYQCRYHDCSVPPNLIISFCRRHSVTYQQPKKLGHKIQCCLPDAQSWSCDPFRTLAICSYVSGQSKYHSVSLLRIPLQSTTPYNVPFGLRPLRNGAPESGSIGSIELPHNLLVVRPWVSSHLVTLVKVE
ncbi:hypothetical protein H5410_002185, partial [Solanum commersonii]